MARSGLDGQHNQAGGRETSVVSDEKCLLYVSLIVLATVFRHHPAHLSIHDTLTATLDSGICKSGGDFGVVRYS